MRICFATNNEHKLKEVKQVMKFVGLDILSLQDVHCSEELPETQNTLEGNSLQKAQYVFEKYSIPCFADDTGLEVDALKGAPGVYSARYAGIQKNSNDNIDLLLKNMEMEENRKAHFRTVIALIGVDDTPTLFEGNIHGSILRERKGSSGFGYDPVFVPQGYSKTFAEMTLDEKNKVSHRAIAVSKLERYLKQYLSHPK
jgi:XTP/dITP diphosphohydrolase